jgi:hypothetical protein
MLVISKPAQRRVSIGIAHIINKQSDKTSSYACGGGGKIQSQTLMKLKEI